MVRTTLGAEVETTVTVSGSEAVDFVSVDSTPNLADGDEEVIVFRPPDGVIYEVMGLRFDALSPSGSDTGDHGFRLRFEGQDINILHIRASGNKRCQTLNGEAAFADVFALPPDPAAFQAQTHGMRLDSTGGLQLRYRNRSGAIQGNRREVRFAVRAITVSN